ncbi:MAG: aminoglycoside phosphotransferase family protein [Geminicoccaceae bacterium]|nr:aminoglycoside phosphotransferase family protein [Geminicoccaceae bacterium]MCB9944521.1 aminoglycoside phosphotransferase family protein [Geminicoccaceae bacterium]
MVNWNSDILSILRRAGLLELGPPPPMEPLTGGVSSDIWRVRIGHNDYCVKRALAKLKVTADWRAPIERSRYEAGWMEEVGRILPNAVPPLVHVDDAGSAIIMRYLDPARFALWKTQLAQGEIDHAFAAAVGKALCIIHRETAGKPGIAARFGSDEIFNSIRIEPYLIATAVRNKAVARPLKELARRTAATRKALVHGDVSPKNILKGPQGPVFLDAECAWYGDPAFDLAFCLNHMLLKSVWKPQWFDSYLDAFSALAGAYLPLVNFEDPEELEGRAATLLAGLMLGRIDGKSPVEYITEPSDKNRVRAIASALLVERPARLAIYPQFWRQEMLR